MSFSPEEFLASLVRLRASLWNRCRVIVNRSDGGNFEHMWDTRQGSWLHPGHPEYDAATTAAKTLTAHVNAPMHLTNQELYEAGLCGLTFMQISMLDLVIEALCQSAGLPLPARPLQDQYVPRPEPVEAPVAPSSPPPEPPPVENDTLDRLAVMSILSNLKSGTPRD